MGFFRERIVQTPRRVYKCYLCGCLIAGKHMYVSASDDYEFHYCRCHISCNEKMVNICSNCDYHSECETDVRECFRNNGQPM